MKWEMVKLREVIDKPVSGEWGDGEGQTPILRTTNFNNDGSLDFTNVVMRNISEKKIREKGLKPGDCIIEKSGGSPTQPVGRVVFFNVTDETYLCNNFTSAIRPTSRIYPKYLFWFLFNNHLSGNTLKYQNKTTGIINLQLERYISEASIPLPPLATQCRIAEILDKADALRQKDQALLRKYDELAQAVFVDMFGDPVKNEKGWEVKKIRDIGKVTTGNTPSRGIVEYYGNHIEWIKSDNIKPILLHPSKAAEFLSEEGLKIGRCVEMGAVLITCIAGSLNSIGNSVLTDRKVAFNQQINAITPKENFNPMFLLALTRASREKILTSTSTSMKKMISKSTLENIEFIAPPLTLQNNFARIYANIERQKELVRKQKTASEAMFEAYLQEAFG